MCLLKRRFIDDPELAYVMARSREVHDFWHVLFDCHTNVFGELALKALEFVQASDRWRLPLRDWGCPSHALCTHKCRCFRMAWQPANEGLWANDCHSRQPWRERSERQLPAGVLAAWASMMMMGQEALMQAVGGCAHACAWDAWWHGAARGAVGRRCVLMMALRAVHADGAAHDRPGGGGRTVAALCGRPARAAGEPRRAVPCRAMPGFADRSAGTILCVQMHS